jgi:hypothetical protein
MLRSSVICVVLAACAPIDSTGLGSECKRRFDGCMNVCSAVPSSAAPGRQDSMASPDSLNSNSNAVWGRGQDAGCVARCNNEANSCQSPPASNPTLPPLK